MTTSIQDTLLVSLSFTLPRQSVQLKDEATKIEQDASAKKGTVRASLFYFQISEGLKTAKDALFDVKSFQNHWRAEHSRLTRPWDGGIRLLPAVLTPQYMEMTKKMKAGHTEKIQAFLDDYPNWAKSAPERMGHLFEKSKFPSLEEVTVSISHDLMYMPLPAAEQFKRISVIAPDMASTMEQVTNERIQKAVAEAQAQTWKDVMNPIQHVVDTLSKDKFKIHESLLGNVLAIVDMVPAFNLQNDPELAALAVKAKEEFSKVTVEDLRKSEELQKSTLSKAKEIINQFEPFARKFL